MRLSRQQLYAALGFALFLTAWQVIGATHIAGPSVPAIRDVWSVYLEPWKLALLRRAAGATLISALVGLAAGTVLGIVVAILAHVLTVLRPGLDRLSVIVNAVPAVALGPILIVTVGRDWTPATLAAIPVFFLIYVNAAAGLRAVSPRLRDLLHILGASRVKMLLYLEAPAALPAFLRGLQIAVTASVVGSIVGEWFGSSTGLGIVILNTMLNFQIPLMWAAVLFASAISLCAYGLIGVCEQAARRRFS